MSENKNDFNFKAIVIVFMLSFAFFVGKSDGESKYYHYRNEINDSILDQQDQVENLYFVDGKVQNLYNCIDEDRFNEMDSDDKVGYIISEDVYDSICAYENSIGTKDAPRLKKQMLSTIDEYVYNKSDDYVNFTDMFVKVSDIDKDSPYDSEKYLDDLSKDIEKISNK